MTQGESVNSLPQEQLIGDLEQLVNLLAASHPDPFRGSGGTIPFYRHAGHIARRVPESGMNAQEFLRLLRPLVAAVRDGHTTIFDPNMPDQLVDVRAMGGAGSSAPRLWVEWEPLDEQLVVSVVPEERLGKLLGMKLTSIEGVSFDELQARMRTLRGDDNVYNNLVHLAEALGHPSLIFDLLEIEPLAAVTLGFAGPGGSSATESVLLSREPQGERQTPPTKLRLDPLGPTRIGWQVIDDAMVLRIGPMMWYREAFEVWRHYGYHHNLSHHLDQLLADLDIVPRPDDLDDRIDAVPAASEIFAEMLDGMASADVSRLIVDLRESTGGNSTIAAVLQFSLFGLEGMVAHDGGYQVRRYSRLFFENNRNVPAEIADGLPGGYDFSEERDWRKRSSGLTDAERATRRRAIIEQAGSSPTFGRLIETNADRPVPPREVVVLTSARTYSAGFDLAATLYKHGATVIGVPSSQSGNCFIDIMRYTLAHSGLQGRISCKWSRLFPDDAETGKMLRPHRELTYAQYAAMGFDQHAALRLALNRDS